MSSPRGIRAGRAYVEFLADDSKLVREYSDTDSLARAEPDRVRGMLHRLGLKRWLAPGAAGKPRETY